MVPGIVVLWYCKASNVRHSVVDAQGELQASLNAKARYKAYSRDCVFSSWSA